MCGAAVALHHWQNGNNGAQCFFFVSGVRLLRHVEPSCQWVDVAALIADSKGVRGHWQPWAWSGCINLTGGLCRASVFSAHESEFIVIEFHEFLHLFRRFALGDHNYRADDGRNLRGIDGTRGKAIRVDADGAR
jgi:hypothetical protein